MKINYQKKLDEIIEKNQKEGVVPTLLVHSCCAPCSSYVLEYLSRFFKITVLYFNPNITKEEEYKKRVKEQKRLISEMSFINPVSFVEGRYDKEEFFAIARGKEDMKEGGERCFSCYELRLSEAGSYAKAHGFDYFVTTLSISPYKNAEKLNEIGERLGEKAGILYLPSDFKKKGGYKRSIELSREYSLYRQDYCGCIYSEIEAKKRKSGN